MFERILTWSFALSIVACQSGGAGLSSPSSAVAQSSPLAAAAAPPSCIGFMATLTLGTIADLNQALGLPSDSEPSIANGLQMHLGYDVEYLSAVAAPQVGGILTPASATVSAFGRNYVALPLSFGGSQNANDNATALAIFTALAEAAGDDPTQVSTAQTPQGLVSCQTTTASAAGLNAHCQIANVIGVLVGKQICNE